MKTLLLIAAMVVIPLTASADFMDVIQVKLNEGCSLETYVQIKNDFNEQWGKKHGYVAEVVAPVQNQDLVSVFWLGRTVNAAAFGGAWDAWRDQLADPSSTASKLSARFLKCSTNETRSGYDIY